MFPVEWPKLFCFDIREGMIEIGDWVLNNGLGLMC